MSGWTLMVKSHAGSSAPAVHIQIAGQEQVSGLGWHQAASLAPVLFSIWSIHQDSAAFFLPVLPTAPRHPARVQLCNLQKTDIMAKTTEAILAAPLQPLNSEMMLEDLLQRLCEKHAVMTHGAIHLQHRARLATIIMAL